MKSCPDGGTLPRSHQFFRYESKRDYLFKRFNLTINKGERIGIIGKTGSGKSTLADIIMGLLMPTEGNLIVDQNKLYYF